VPPQTTEKKVGRIVNMAWLEHCKRRIGARGQSAALGSYLLVLLTGYYLVRACTGRTSGRWRAGSTGARNVGRVLGRAGSCSRSWEFQQGVLAVWAALHLTTGGSRLRPWRMLRWSPDTSAPRNCVFKAAGRGGVPGRCWLVYDWHIAVTWATLFLAGFGAHAEDVLPALFAYACLRSRVLAGS